jgi:large exoprotein involved in heme utilization and adhesion
VVAAKGAAVTAAGDFFATSATSLTFATFATFASTAGAGVGAPSLVVAYKVAPLMTNIAGPASNANFDMIWHPFRKLESRMENRSSPA